MKYHKKLIISMVAGKAYDGWEEFKRGVTLATESGTTPNIVVTGHEDIDALPAKVQSGAYALQNVLTDATKIQDAGLVKAGYGFYPRVSNGRDYWQFYTGFGGQLENEVGKLVFDENGLRL